MNFKAARLMPVLLLSASAMGQEVAFSLTPAEFQQRFSAIATKDGGDRILNLQREKGVYKAVLADFQFQKSVAAFNLNP